MDGRWSSFNAVHTARPPEGPSNNSLRIFYRDICTKARVLPTQLTGWSNKHSRVHARIRDRAVISSTLLARSSDKILIINCEMLRFRCYVLDPKSCASGKLRRAFPLWPFDALQFLKKAQCRVSVIQWLINFRINLECAQRYNNNVVYTSMVCISTAVLWILPTIVEIQMCNSNTGNFVTMIVTSFWLSIGIMNLHVEKPTH